jgi:hypothetical protein
MRHWSGRGVWFGSLLGLFVAGCGEVPSDGGAASEDPNIEKLYGGLEGDPGWGYWNTSPWQTDPAIIRVCWENPTASDATFRG